LESLHLNAERIRKFAALIRRDRIFIPTSGVSVCWQKDMPISGFDQMDWNSRTWSRDTHLDAICAAWTCCWFMEWIERFFDVLCTPFLGANTLKCGAKSVSPNQPRLHRKLTSEA
jgi:hypothetical protein